MLIDARDQLSESMSEESWRLDDGGGLDPETSFSID
jgi:hypothetical protein